MSREYMEVLDEFEEFIRQDVQREFKALIERAFLLKRQIKAMLDRDAQYLTSEQYLALETLYQKLDEVLKDNPTSVRQKPDTDPHKI